MPEYFPDLKSVKNLAIDMSNNSKGKEYKGIIPKTEEELPEARKQLADYMRKVWHDEIFALEIELAVDVDNYETKISEHIQKRFLNIKKEEFN